MERQKAKGLQKLATKALVVVQQAQWVTRVWQVQSALNVCAVGVAEADTYAARQLMAAAGCISARGFSVLSLKDEPIPYGYQFGCWDAQFVLAQYFGIPIGKGCCCPSCGEWMDCFGVHSQVCHSGIREVGVKATQITEVHNPAVANMAYVLRGAGIAVGMEQRSVLSTTKKRPADLKVGSAALAVGEAGKDYVIDLTFPSATAKRPIKKLNDLIGDVEGFCTEAAPLFHFLLFLCQER